MTGADGLFISGPAGLGPVDAVRLEERLLAEVQSGGVPAIARVWRNGWCAVLGKNNKEEEWINAGALEADGVPVIRRDSGGGAVIHHPGNLNFTFIMARDLASGIMSPTSAIPYFIAIAARAMSFLDVSAQHRGVSDLFVDGYKVGGNAQRIKSRAILHHGTVLMKSELERMERYLKIPPNRPGVPHRGFVAGLWELGYPVGFGRLSHALARAFSEVAGIKLAPADLPHGVSANLAAEKGGAVV